MILKLATFEIDTPFGRQQRLGAADEDGGMIDLRSACAVYLRDKEGEHAAGALAAAIVPAWMVDLVAAGERRMATVRAAVAHAEALLAGQNATSDPEFGELRFAPGSFRYLPVLTPGKMIYVGRNYPKHAAESTMPPPDDFPRGFIKVNSTLVGHDCDIPYPSATRELDYEVELVVVIGKAGRDISPERAYEHVFGYTVANDMSARDWQFEERKKGNHLLGKNLDATGPLGPYIVPKEDAPDPMNVRLMTRVNGSTRQDSNTKFMTYDIPRLIAHFSKMTLQPGDIIATGSPEGIARAQENADELLLKPGDVIEVEAAGIGVLRNRIVASHQNARLGRRK